MVNLEKLMQEKTQKSTENMITAQDKLALICLLGVMSLIIGALIVYLIFGDWFKLPEVDTGMFGAPF